MTLPVSARGRRYGFHKSPKDHRDLSAFRILAPTPIPPAVDLSQWTGPVKDQGQEGSCTAHAGSENLEYLFRKFKNQQPIFSPQFLYYVERQMDNDLPGDNGSYGRTSVKCMQTYGCCTLASDPYDPSQMDTAPTDAQLAEAKQYMAGAYHGLHSVDEMKQCIASGFPFLIGFTVTESFEQIGSDGVMPSPSGSVLGGHEVLVIGYDDNQNGGSFRVRNSWGTGWGLTGDFFMAYAIMADWDNVIMEAWIQHFGHAWK